MFNFWQLGDPWNIWIDVYSLNQNSKIKAMRQLNELPHLKKLYISNSESNYSIILHHDHPAPAVFCAMLESVLEENLGKAAYNFFTGA